MTSSANKHLVPRQPLAALVPPPAPGPVLPWEQGCLSMSAQFTLPRPKEIPLRNPLVDSKGQLDSSVQICIAPPTESPNLAPPAIGLNYQKDPSANSCG